MIRTPFADQWVVDRTRTRTLTKSGPDAAAVTVRRNEQTGKFDLTGRSTVPARVGTVSAPAPAEEYLGALAVTITVAGRSSTALVEGSSALPGPGSMLIPPGVGADPVVPGHITLEFRRLSDALFAGEALLWSHGLDFEHVENLHLRHWLEQLGTVPEKHAYTPGGVALDEALRISLQSVVDDEGRDDVTPDLLDARADLTLAANGWALTNNQTNRCVAHALLRILYGADL